jgi:hypothetical protein
VSRPELNFVDMLLKNKSSSGPDKDAADVRALMQLKDA